MKRVVISGLGVVSPLGSDLATVWNQMKAGASGVGPITKFDATDYVSRIAGEVSGFDPSVAVDRKAQHPLCAAVWPPHEPEPSTIPELPGPGVSDCRRGQLVDSGHFLSHSVSHTRYSIWRDGMEQHETALPN